MGGQLIGQRPEVLGCQPGLNDLENPVLPPEGYCSPRFMRCPIENVGVLFFFDLKWDLDTYHT